MKLANAHTAACAGMAIGIFALLAGSVMLLRVTLDQFYVTDPHGHRL